MPPIEVRPSTYKIFLEGWNDYSLPFWIAEKPFSFYYVRLNPCAQMHAGGLVNRIEQAMERSKLVAWFEAHR